MPRILSCCLLLVLCALSPAASRAQPTDANQVSKVFAVLSASVDTKTAARGDEVLLTTMQDVIVNGKVVIPRGSKLVGHVGSVAIRGKDAAKSALAIVIDKALVKHTEIPLQAIVAAIAAPQIAESTQKAPAAALEKPHDDVLLLREDSAGANGYPGVSLAWNLTIPPTSTIFAVDAKSLKLVSGTQMLLRMIPPQGSN